MKNNLHQNIGDLYNEHFYKQKVKNTKIVTSVVKMRGLESDANEAQESLGIHFKMIKRRYSQSLEYSTTEDFIQEYSILFIDACYRLEVLEPLELLLAQPEIYKSRLSFIKQHITRGFISVANPESMVIKTRNGRKYIDVQMESLDKTVGDEGNQTTLMNLLGDENNLYATYETHHNHFINWVLENHSDILTKKQDKVFVALLDCYQPLVDRSKETLQLRKEMFEIIEIENSNIDKMFKTIKKRCINKYLEHYDGMQSHITVNSQNLHDLLKNYIKVANNPNTKTVEERQAALTKIISKNYNINEEFEIIITKGLKLEDKIEIVRGVKEVDIISHRVLRLIRTNIENYLASHSQLTVKPIENNFNYKEDIFENITDLPSSHGRLTSDGTIQYKDEETGEWKTFEG